MKEPLRATRLSVAPGNIPSAIKTQSNQIPKQILFEEQHAADLESLKDEFGLITSATTTPGLLKGMLNAFYMRSVNVLPQRFGVDANAGIMMPSRAYTTLFTNGSAYGTREGLWVIPILA